jgi:hypothetical protein
VDVSTPELWFGTVEAASIVDARAQEFVAAVAARQIEIGTQRQTTRRHVRDALQTQDERAHEQQECDEARHGIARQAQEKRGQLGAVGHLPEGQRLARLDRDLPEVQPTFRRDGRTDMVFLAYRYAARRDDQVVALGGAAQRVARGCQRVGTMPKSVTSQPRFSSRPRSVNRFEL